MRPRLVLLALALVCSLADLSCRKKTVLGDGLYANQATDSVDVGQNEAALLVAATEDADPDATEDELATAAADSAGRHYAPAGCYTATSEGATVTYVLSDCTGPLGLVHVSGTVVVRFSIRAGTVHATATATGLQVNGATMDVDAEADYAVEGSTQILAVATSGSGTGPRGTEFSRSGETTATWDPATECFSLDGDWSTTVGAATWSTSVDSFEKCGESCPAAGGSISYTGGLSGVTITVTYDGSADAQWESSRGRSGTVVLFCDG